MNVTLIRGPISDLDADWLALGVFEDQTDAPSAARDRPLGALIERLVSRKDVSGEVGKTTPLFGVAGMAAGAVVVAGLGPRATFGAGAAFTAGLAIARKVAGKTPNRLAVVLPDAGPAAAVVASALIEGVVVGGRGSDLRKSEPAGPAFESLALVVDQEPDDALTAAVRRGVIVGESVNLARDLANTPPAEKPPTRLAEHARAVATAAGVGVEVWDRARIERERFGGLLGVAAGSDEPPAVVVLDYLKGGDAPTLALVGKGVTFDSGGLSLKPTASMEDMKADMTGAAVVLATLAAVGRLGLAVNVRGYLVLTENMTGGKALKLGDVLTMRNGKTVEVLNTDAEGRLILADALSFAAEARPDRMLDLATLTGACVVALGVKVAGLFASDDRFADAILNACRTTGERAWRLPLDDDYRELLKSTVADLKNVGGKWAGAISAAKFLQEFVGDVPWAHLDIAGPSWSDSESATQHAGGTGCFVRTLVTLVESETNQSPA